jgi:hypothetical protein
MPTTQTTEKTPNAIKKWVSSMYQPSRCQLHRDISHTPRASDECAAKDTAGCSIAQNHSDHSSNCGSNTTSMLTASELWGVVLCYGRLLWRSSRENLGRLSRGIRASRTFGLLPRLHAGCRMQACCMLDAASRALRLTTARVTTTFPTVTAARYRSAARVQQRRSGRGMRRAAVMVRSSGYSHVSMQLAGLFVRADLRVAVAMLCFVNL